MICEICGNKPMNCDCSREAKELFYLRQELEEQREQTKANIINSSGQERRELFKQVAVRLIDGKDGFAELKLVEPWYVIEARVITEAILKAADEFEKEQKE